MPAVPPPGGPSPPVPSSARLAPSPPPDLGPDPPFSLMQSHPQSFQITLFCDLFYTHTFTLPCFTFKEFGSFSDSLTLDSPKSPSSIYSLKHCLPAPPRKVTSPAHLRTAPTHCVLSEGTHGCAMFWTDALPSISATTICHLGTPIFTALPAHICTSSRVSSMKLPE